VCSRTSIGKVLINNPTLSHAIQELIMITAIVRFPLPQGISLEDVKTVYEHSVPQFREAPGLLRKYYLHSADRTGGGVYL
jgi:hypothetical protein